MDRYLYTVDMTGKKTHTHGQDLHIHVTLYDPRYISQRPDLDNKLPEPRRTPGKVPLGGMAYYFAPWHTILAPEPRSVQEVRHELVTYID